MSKIRVLIARDTFIAREGYSMVLEGVEDMEVFGEAASAQETADLVRAVQPDVALIHLEWFGEEAAGSEVIARVARESPRTKVIAITAYRDLIQEARQAGAAAVLTSGFSRDELLDLIRATHQGRRWWRSKALSRIIRLAVAVGIPAFGCVVVGAVLVWGANSLTVIQLALAVVFALIVYLYLVVLVGRRVDVIREAATYALLVKTLMLCRARVSDVWRSATPSVDDTGESEQHWTESD